MDVTLRNPLGLELTLPAAFTYDPGTCPASDRVGGLQVVKEAGTGRLRATWPAGLDPCRASWAVFAAADPTGLPPFPAGWQDVTAADEDGVPGGDPSFLWTPPVASLLWLEASGVGEDGSLGPR